jgi:2-phospho-L-lactate guanylyltransferase (CobY/MobA/RfbA family)
VWTMAIGCLRRSVLRLMDAFMANDRQATHHETWAVVPVKEIVLAKQRLANFLPHRLRQEQALTMFENVSAKASTMLMMPGDIPLVSPSDIAKIPAAHPSAPAFTIVPAWDERGSNAIICSPADLISLRFGPDSFFPHLAAARVRGLDPNVIQNRAISLDIDEPAELTMPCATNGNRDWEETKDGVRHLSAHKGKILGNREAC